MHGEQGLTRIAATAFESQEALLITDAERKILRVRLAFYPDDRMGTRT